MKNNPSTTQDETEVRGTMMNMQWQQKTDKLKKSKEEKEEPLYLSSDRGERFLRHAMQERGLAISVQERDGALSTRLHDSHCNGVKKKLGRRRHKGQGA